MAFRITPRTVRRGFDRSASPDYQMVPLGQQRQLTLHGGRVTGGDFGNTTVVGTTVAPLVSRRLESHVTFEGRAPGRTQVRFELDSLRPGAAPGEIVIDIAVKAPRTISTSFFYVSDGARQVTRRQVDPVPGRRGSGLQALIDDTNDILGPQANVWIKSKKTEALAISENLGRIVSPDTVTSSGRTEEAVIFAGKDPDADLNIFFVREVRLRGDAVHGDTEGYNLGGTNCIMIEDRIAGNDGITIAHESVHALLGGTRHAEHVRRRRNLMHEISGGRYLNKAQIDALNITDLAMLPLPAASGF